MREQASFCRRRDCNPWWSLTAMLIADRFLLTCHRSNSPAWIEAMRGVRSAHARAALATRGLGIGSLDLATGRRVRLRITACGIRSAQLAWMEECARAHSLGSIVDFGFIGASLKFDAVAPRCAVCADMSAGRSASILDWLDAARPASPGILYLQGLPDGREIRLRGFVPCTLSLFENRSVSRDILSVVACRSVAILDARDMPSLLALTLLRLRAARAREVRALVQRSTSASVCVPKVAERTPVYDNRTSGADPRVRAMIADGEQLAARGRHAAAERALRAAVGACERRNDAAAAGDAAMKLGRLLLSRGRASDAEEEFERALERFHRVGTAAPAVEAAMHVGIAQTDLQRFADAERSCRAAYSSASGTGSADLVSAAAIALARVHIWQHRFGDARSLLECLAPSSVPEVSARRWCLLARVMLAANSLGDAWRAIERARPARGHSSTIEALVRTWEAAVQAKLGDVESLRIHVKAGLEAARSAHWPAQSMRLRLTLVEGLIAGGRNAQARLAARHLAHVRAGSMPALLRARADRVMKVLDGDSTVLCPPSPSAHESTARFHSSVSGGAVEDLDGLRQLLSISHQLEDEREALARTVEGIARHTHAIGAGIYAYREGEVVALATCGSCSAVLAKRSADTGAPIRPEGANGWVEGAAPVQYLGRTVGALVIRWSVEGPDNVDRAIAFGSAAGAACAPLVYVLSERQSPPPLDEPACDLVGVSSAVEEMRKAIRRAGNAPFTVLIEGESGSGKELVARAVHRAGCRRDRSFCALNCAAMPEDLVDAELFGHAKGAFTGASGERMGIFEAADGGSVFLDEVGELSARAQAKMLRVLQEGEIRRVGETFTRPFDARLIAATNRSLRVEVEAGRFRQDLLYRLDVIRINVPPLRERIEDIPLLAAQFWRQCAKRVGSKAVLGQGALSALARYDWPGNVRELQNVLAALVVAVPSRGIVGVSELPAALARAMQAAPHESLDSARVRFEQRFVRAALARAAGHKGRTAAALGLSRQGLAKLMQRLQLDA
jgi:transcriptional regulator with AAA-type ATPase domain